MGDDMPSTIANAISNWSEINGTDEQLAALQLFQGYPRELLQFAAVCCVLFMLIGIPGNLCAIIALVMCKKVRNATAIFIINLSFADLVYCCFNLPLAASTFWLQSWPHGILLCRLFPLARFALAAVSLLTVLAITTNRYVLILHPLLYSKLYKTRNLGFIIASIWIFSFLSLLATWFGEWGQFGLNVTTSYCSVLPDHDNYSPARLLFLLAFIIPFLTICVCYSRIFIAVRNTTTRSRGSVRRKRITDLEDFSSTSNARDSDAYTNQVTSSERVTSIRIETPQNATAMSSSDMRPVNQSSKMFTKGLRTTVLNLRRSQAIERALPSSKDKKLLTMITAIMATFFICYLPITVIEVSRELTSHPVAYILSYILRYFTTCINPVIYVVMSSEYRKAYKKVLKKCLR